MMADGNPAAIVDDSVDLGRIAHVLRVTKRWAGRLALREKWIFTEHKVRGGCRRMYPVSALPADINNAIKHANAVAAAQQAAARNSNNEGASLGDRIALTAVVDDAVQARAQQQGAADAAGLAGREAERMNARLDLLAALTSFARHQACGISAALEPFAAAYAAGDIGSDAVRAVIGDEVSASTLKRWRKVLKTQGAAALAGQYGNRAGSGTIDSHPELQEFVLGVIAAKPHIGGKLLHQALLARFANRDIAVPPLRSVQRYLTDWKNKNHELYTAIANPDRWKNRYKTAQGDRGGEAYADGLNDRWEFDSTPADVMLRDGRHTIVGVIDVWSRRLILHVARTSSSSAVCQALRKAILKWGVLRTAKIDNGQDYVSHRVQRALTGLGVETELSQPFSPWEKPHIERVFGTFSHGLMTLLPSYCGHNVAAAQELRARESFADRLTKKNAVMPIDLDAKTLQMFCDRWCETIYEQDKHAGIGTTPYLKAASWRGEVRRVDNLRALDLLLAEAPDNNGLRTVTKKGLRIDGLEYAAPELAILVREQVQVLYEPDGDLGQVVVYHEGRFVCVAECPEVLGHSRADVAVMATAMQQQRANEGRKAMRAAAKKVRVNDIVEEIFAHRQREAQSLAALPPPTVLHMTPGLTAATAATEALQAAASTSAELPPLTMQDFVDLREMHRAEQQQNDTEESRFQRAIRLMGQAEPLDEVNARWLATYRQGSEFGGRWMVFEEWGGAPFGLGDEYDHLSPMLNHQLETL